VRDGIQLRSAVYALNLLCSYISSVDQRSCRTLSFRIANSTVIRKEVSGRAGSILRACANLVCDLVVVLRLQSTDESNRAIEISLRKHHIARFPIHGHHNVGSIAIDFAAPSLEVGTMRVLQVSRDDPSGDVTELMS
jgi:hypothetical protein